MNLTINFDAFKGSTRMRQDGSVKSGFRDLVKQVFKHQVERSLKSIEKIHLLEEENNDINQDQTAQA